MSASFCWHCGRKLQLPYFTEITTPSGDVLRVHKACKQNAQRQWKPITAAQCDEYRDMYDPEPAPMRVR